MQEILPDKITDYVIRVHTKVGVNKPAERHSCLFNYWVFAASE